MIVNADRVPGRVTGLTGDGVWAGNVGDAAAMGRLLSVTASTTPCRCLHLADG